MPTYIYVCSECGSSKEVQHSMADCSNKDKHPKCCETTMTRGITAPALSGFDNYGRSQ
jgi:putative FmdB family regulatory protein